MRNLAHLADKNVIIAWVGDRPIEAGEYLGSIAGDEPGEILGENFHAVFIDELEKNRTSVARHVLRGTQPSTVSRRATHFAQLVNLQLEFGAVLVLLDRAQEEIDLSNDNLCQRAGPGRTAGAGTSTST